MAQGSSERRAESTRKCRQQESLHWPSYVWGRSWLSTAFLKHSCCRRRGCWELTQLLTHLAVPGAPGQVTRAVEAQPGTRPATQMRQ